MKELSIEEKAKAYDEALKKAKKLQKTCDSQAVVGWCEHIFPELKESEDERIRKELIDYINRLTATPNNIDKCNAWLDWLEKQRKHLENYNEAEKEKADFVGDGFIECHADFLDFKEGNTYWLEYIGDDKYNVRSDNLLGKTYHITPCQLYTIFKKQTWLEKEREKHTDKSEPKFKVSDWVTNSIETVQITGYDIDYGYQVDYKGNLQHRDTDIIEKEYHLWTIADAKDGDILVDEDINVMGIFEGIEGMCWHSKFYYSNTTKEFYGTEYGGSHQKEFAKPATKEQRETLFKAMHKAGYTFDFEKKELKKVEQKPAWSEEDEKNLQGIIDEIQANKNSAPSYDIPVYEGFLNWLKSIRQRIGG